MRTLHNPARALATSARRNAHRPSRRVLGIAALGLLTVVALAATAPGASAFAIIDNGVVQIGVNDEGHLNTPSGSGTPSMQTQTTSVGLRYLPTNAESTAPGCLCEGWGVSYDGSTSGRANAAMGPAVVNLNLVSFTSTPSEAVSVVTMGDLEITHDYHPSPNTPNLYEVEVTIQNNGMTAHGNVKYRRTMDWDIEPTAFAEHVTIETVNPPPAALVTSTTNGFDNPDPLVPPQNSMWYMTGPPTMPNIIDAGPNDHGALFDFDFGTVPAGGIMKFKIFYGAAEDEASAYAALNAVGAEVWSLGQSSATTGLGDPSTGTPNTFIFAFGALNFCIDSAKAVGVDNRFTMFQAADIAEAGPLSGVDPDQATTSVATASYSSNLFDLDAHGVHSEARIKGCDAKAVFHLDEGTVDPFLTPPLPNLPIVEFENLEVVSHTTCLGSSGWVTAERVVVNGVPVVDGTNSPIAPNTVVPFGAGTVTLNEQTPIQGGLEVNGIHIRFNNGDEVLIGHTVTSVFVVGNPTCPPPDTPPTPTP